VAVNYRLSPQARFPDHLVDCKRALAWIRRNVKEYGGDPAFVAVTGGSAGGHLAALMALTCNDRALQPGFERVDTSIAACVPFYGVYDFIDRAGVRHDAGKMVQLLTRSVMPCPPRVDPVLWDLASPITHVRPDAPPFFVLHGTHDSLAKVEEAREFVARLRAVSRSPVAYAELPGAQHAWDFFHSVRSIHSVHAVGRFLEWVHAEREAGRQVA
jgi:acetyl esterase/lipase